jgi:hypothetical protein
MVLESQLQLPSMVASHLIQCVNVLVVEVVAVAGDSGMALMTDMSGVTAGQVPADHTEDVMMIAEEKDEMITAVTITVETGQAEGMTIDQAGGMNTGPVEGMIIGPVGEMTDAEKAMAIMNNVLWGLSGDSGGLRGPQTLSRLVIREYNPRIRCHP